MKNKRVVVTGGAGFIGTNLVERLCNAGYDVTVVDDFSAGRRDRLPQAATVVEASVLDIESVEQAFEGAAAIVHLAALPRVQFSIEEPKIAHRVNVDGTLTVLEAARQAGVRRVVFAASSAAYGDQEVLPLHEGLPIAPKSPYALHKCIGESCAALWAQLYGLETVSLRFFNVYGPHLDPDGPYALVIGRFLKQRLLGEPLTITGSGAQTRDFVHVRDVVAAVHAALESEAVGSGEVINVGSGVATSVNELAQLIGGPVTYVPPRIEPMHTCADITRVTTLLGWQPSVSLPDGIRELKQLFGIAD